MSVPAFEYEPELIDRFVRFGFEHYDGDEQWVPPFEKEVRRQLSPDFEFTGTQGGLRRHFLAFHGDHVQGRVAAMIHPDLKDGEGQPVGTVGFYECSTDFDVARRLLGAAVGWLAARGVRRIWGPMQFDIWHGYRFMTRGFEEERFLGEPYNKPFYPRQFQRFGFAPIAEWDSVVVEGRTTLERMIERGALRFEQLAQRGYRFDVFDTRRWDREVERMREIVCRSFSRFLGFTPISPEEFARLFASGRRAMLPRLCAFVRNERGDLAGFAAGYIELARAVKAMGGRDHWPARLRYLIKRHQADRVNFYIGGITPEEEARRSGLGRAGFYYVIHEALEAGFEKVMLTLRFKGAASRAYTARHAPAPQREYALYGLRL